MAEFIEFSRKKVKHIYNLDNCSGCGRIIAELEEYNEIVLTSGDGETETHIALCDDCYKESQNYIDI